VDELTSSSGVVARLARIPHEEQKVAERWLLEVFDSRAERVDSFDLTGIDVSDPVACVKRAQKLLGERYVMAAANGESPRIWAMWLIAPLPPETDN
jgi:hypothetical protein